MQEKVEAYKERLKMSKNDVEENKLSEEDCLISSIINAADLDEFSSTDFEIKDEYLSSNEAKVTSTSCNDVGNSNNLGHSEIKRSEDEELSQDETNAKEVDEIEDVTADSDPDNIFDKQTTVDTKEQPKRTTSQSSISDEDVKEFAKNRKSGKYEKS